MVYWGKTEILTVEDDITKQDVDAIVNAANPSLTGGRGVDGAIHEKGGSQILDECLEIRRKFWPNGLPPGYAVITNGGLLKARYVIHTVGPIWKGGGWGEAKTLVECYNSCLTIVKEKGLNSVAFPPISTGYYGYPQNGAYTIAFDTVKKFCVEYQCPEKVVFASLSDWDYNRR